VYAYSVGWRTWTLSAILLVAGLTVGGAAIGLAVHGPAGALVGVIPGALAGVAAGYVPSFRDRAEARQERLAIAKRTWEAVRGPRRARRARSPAEFLRADKGVVVYRFIMS